MPVQYSYRGRVITPEDILFLRQFIAEHSQLSRRKLSAKVCEAWQWKQANGALCDMVCRGLLLMLHRAGEIQLPEVRFVARNPFVKRERPQPMSDRHNAGDRAAERTAAGGCTAGAPHRR